MDHGKCASSFSLSFRLENLYDDFTLCYVRQDYYANYAADALVCSPLYCGPRHVFRPDAHAAQEARNKHDTPAGPKAKKAKKSAETSVVPKKRGRGRPRQSEEEQDTIAIDDEDEEEGAQSPRRKKVEEGGEWSQSVHGMSMRGSKKQEGYYFEDDES